MTRRLVSMAVLCGSLGWAKDFPLRDGKGLTPVNVAIEPAVHAGKAGIRVTAKADGEQLAILDGIEFSNGVIEVELSGAPASGASEAARGFVGIAFRLANETTYECFYLRPTNGRADDQLRRNHSTQYISHPEWTWSKLRQEQPGVYESYVDLVPGAWTRVRITVDGSKARLYVHGSDQPALIVNGLKGGAAAGKIALWVGPGTQAHFRALQVNP